MEARRQIDEGAPLDEERIRADERARIEQERAATERKARRPPGRGGGPRADRRRRSPIAIRTRRSRSSVPDRSPLDQLLTLLVGAALVVLGVFALIEIGHRHATARTDRAGHGVRPHSTARHHARSAPARC